jgi:hypothetical protein
MLQGFMAKPLLLKQYNYLGSDSFGGFFFFFFFLHGDLDSWFYLDNYEKI